MAWHVFRNTGCLTDQKSLWLEWRYGCARMCVYWYILHEKAAELAWKHRVDPGVVHKWATGTKSSHRAVELARKKTLVHLWIRPWIGYGYKLHDETVELAWKILGRFLKSNQGSELTKFRWPCKTRRDRARGMTLIIWIWTRTEQTKWANHNNNRKKNMWTKWQ